MAKNIKVRIQNKHDLEFNWLQATFVPLQGELIIYDIEVDANGHVLTKPVNGVNVPLLPANRTVPYTYERFKIGDGITSINNLPFIGITNEEREKLAGISADADSVSFSRDLTSGTKVGTITINGTDTDLYAPTNTAYDTGTSTDSGLTKLYSATGSNADGTMTQSAITAALAEKETSGAAATALAKAKAYTVSELATLISYGTSDPDSNITSQFYFKYTTE